MKLFKLIFMVRFNKILEWISPEEKAAPSRSEPMRTGKDIRKINEDCHKVYTSS